MLILFFLAVVVIMASMFVAVEYFDYKLQMEKLKQEQNQDRLNQISKGF
jgi:uncharacterized protein involved in cysteine biosynthesis